MKTFKTALVILAWASFAGAAEKFKPVKPYVEGEIVVRFKEAPDSWAAREINRKLGGTPLKTLKKMNLALIQLPPGMDTVKGVEKYRREPGVVTAEPNYVVTPIKRPAKKAPPKNKK